MVEMVTLIDTTIIVVTFIAITLNYSSVTFVALALDASITPMDARMFLKIGSLSANDAANAIEEKPKTYGDASKDRRLPVIMMVVVKMVMMSADIRVHKQYYL